MKTTQTISITKSDASLQTLSEVQHSIPIKIKEHKNVLLPFLKPYSTQVDRSFFQRENGSQTNPVQTKQAVVQCDSALQDINTIVLVANASLFNFRTEMPIYTDTIEREFTTTAHLKKSLAKMGLKKLIQEEEFKRII